MKQMSWVSVYQNGVLVGFKEDTVCNGNVI